MAKIDLILLSKNSISGAEKLFLTYEDRVHSWIELYYPACTNKHNLHLETFAHVFSEKHSYQPEFESNDLWIAKTSIAFIIKQRATTEFMRPVQELYKYTPKYKDFHPDLLHELPELEKLAVLLRDVSQFPLHQIAFILGLNVKQINWLLFNTDSILHSIEKSGTPVPLGIVSQTTSTASFAYNHKSKAWLGFVAAYPQLAGKTKLPLWQKAFIGISTFIMVGVLIGSAIGYTGMNFLPQPHSGFTPYVTTTSIEKPFVNPEEKQTVLPAKKHKLVLTQVPISSIKVLSENVPIISAIKTVEAAEDEPVVVQRNPISLPQIGIKAHIQKSNFIETVPKKLELKPTNPLPKKHLWASIGMVQSKLNTPKITHLITGSIGFENAINKKSSWYIHIGFIAVNHAAQIAVQRQYLQPTTSGKTITDSVVRNQSAFLQIPIGYQFKLNQKISLGLGIYGGIHLFDRGTAFTKSNYNSDINDVVKAGRIAQTSTLDFATFDRISIVNTVHLGINGHIEWMPIPTGNWKLQLSSGIPITRFFTKSSGITTKIPPYFALKIARRVYSF
ncbi:MAG: sigma-70 family RNA polymerase sigma factor [Bacteroidia bacterium]|nr:sigma-70 family RNA polymerase sigma factor [Bacteroidia bacterium]